MFADSEMVLSNQRNSANNKIIENHQFPGYICNFVETLTFHLKREKIYLIRYNAIKYPKMHAKKTKNK